MKKSLLVIASLILVILIKGCISQKLDKILVFNPTILNEYDFSRLKVPSSNWAFLWITNQDNSTCAIKIERKIGVNDSLSNIWVLFCHGNTATLDVAPVNFGNLFYELGINFFAMEYRGFGIISNFTPSEDSTYEDAENALNYLVNTLGVPKSNIVIMGHSLGGGVATEIAKRHNLRGLILVSTFTKIRNAGEMVTTYAIPSEPYINSVYDNLSKIDQVGEPILFIHGKADTTLSFEFSKQLYEKAKEPKYYLWIDNCNHSSDEIINKGGQQLKDAIINFISGL
ncbi:MAG: alpha/beta hydrolase [Brevinematia bacterium]